MIMPILFSAQQIKRIYGIHRNTLLLWEKQGLIKPIRTPGGRRRYLKDEIERLLGLNKSEQSSRITVLYARVSTRKQEPYLRNQVARLESYAREKGWRYEVITDIASGLNENRRGLRRLLNRIRKGEVDRVVVEYPDRLARFGLGYLKSYFEAFGVELIIINGEHESQDRIKELVQDLIAIVSSFATRIYGSRRSERSNADNDTG